MSNDKQGISRRKMLGALAATGAAAGVGGAGTYAYITDENTADVNFQAGSIVLQITPKTVDFTADNDKQDDGGEMLTTITLRNAGTLPAKYLWLSSVNLTGPEDLKKNAEITTFNIIYEGNTTEDALDSGSSLRIDDREDPDDNNEFLDLAGLKKAAETAPLPMMKTGQELKSLTNNKIEIELGVTYNYAGITTNGEDGAGVLEVDFGFRAKQDQ